MRWRIAKIGWRCAALFATRLRTRFSCLQGQITVFLISVFGHRVSSVAEVGALGRLAMIFAVLSNLLTNVFAPAFARCQEAHRLRWLYGAIIGGVIAFS